MEYFKGLLQLLQVEKEADRQAFAAQTASMSVAARREAGLTWYPVAIRDTEIGRGDYLTVEVERTAHQDILHNLRFGMTAALFSQHQPAADRVEGVITHLSGDRLKLTLRTDELPDWTRRGKLGIDAVFDENSYEEMEKALKQALLLAESPQKAPLVPVLTGRQSPAFDLHGKVVKQLHLNATQGEAVHMILAARQLAIVHGPPGTGKTTTLVEAVRLLAGEGQKILVTAPSNAAVDLLTERLAAAGLAVVRVGNPARVSEALMSLTLDRQVAMHGSMKQVKELKKRAASFRDMAQKYKRQFGRDEREQRKALFAEARAISREIEKTEQYISADILSRAQVITATLVGANHYTVQHLSYDTVFIDEAAQALEPACWIPALKGKKLVLAGDHHQLPPTIKSIEAAREGLGTSLMEKLVAAHPQAVVLLKEQYRMHAAIMEFSSREFYNGELVAHPGVAGHTVFPGDAPLLFIDTAGCGYEEVVEDVGISNPEEGALLLKHLGQYLESVAAKGLPPPSVGIIAPYRHQVEWLKEKLAATPQLQAHGGLAVNTVDAFQGGERDIIYISMTRSNADGAVGFLSDTRRMNVALTRARKKLVVAGDSATLAAFPFYADFINYAQLHHAYISAWELMDW